MNPSPADNLRSRVEQLAAQLLDGNLSAAEQAELLRAIDQDAEACDRLVRQVALHAVLRDEVGEFRPRALDGDLFGVSSTELAELTAGLTSMAGQPRSLGARPPGINAGTAPPIVLPIDNDGQGMPGAPETAFSRSAPHGEGIQSRFRGIFSGLRPASLGWKAAAAAGVALLVTASIAFRQANELADYRRQERAARLAQVERLDQGAGHSAVSAPQYVATLVNLTNCRWDKAEGVAGSDQQGLQPGQSLHLLEGVAEINSIRPSGNRCTFQLEGPLAMTLTRDGMPSLLYGKLAGVFSGDSNEFALETPLGRIVVTYDASLGVSATANTVELHVFEGEAFVEPLYSLDPDSAPEHLRAAAGVSLRIVTSREERLSVERGVADPHSFVSQVSMAANRIHITDKYVAAIRQDRPIAYWRFEGVTDDCVLNEIDDRFHCRLYGSGLRWHAYAGNTAAEMGSTPQVSCLLSDDVLDGAIRESYSLEAWIKPSHFHHAAVFSLAEIPSQTQAIARPRTGMLLELCGPVNSRSPSHESWAGHPGRIRFLHRNPPGSFTGNSCFSEKSYVPRKWQHVVTVKDGRQLRLYIDGVLAAEAEDRTELPSGMRVLIGQLHPHDPRRVVAVRPFVGELDEIALYDRPLSADQIKSHFQLANPAAGGKSESSAGY